MKNRAEKIFSVGKTSAPYSDAVKIKTETGVGVLKTIIVFLILIAQAILFVYLSVYFVNIATWAFALSIVFSLTTCVVVLSSNKNGLSKAVWIIFILLCFTFGYILYFMSDERLFFRKAKRRYDAIYQKTQAYFSPSTVSVASSAVQSDINYLYSAGKFPTYNATDLKYYNCGTLFFDDVMDDIKKAKTFVFIEFFIISDGALLNRFIDLLTDCVKRGVDVRIVYDDMGSHKTLSLKNKNLIKNAGVKLVAFNRLIPVFSLAHNVRDHRKIIVIDGKIAYTGGCNLADEYVNEKRMYGYWKDCAVKLDGSAVDTFTLTFIRQWEFLTKKEQEYKAYLRLFNGSKNLSAVTPYADGLDFDKHVGRSVYENMIGSAQNKIMIMTPYFIVDDSFMEMLINKALSGVKVTLIIPQVPDKKYAYAITRSNSEKLIDYGVNVYVMENSFVHSKVVLTENSVVVGSINLDFRSFYQQFECAVYTNDKQFMSAVEKDFENVISASILISQRTKYRKSLLYRIYAGFMQLFAPFM